MKRTSLPPRIESSRIVLQRHELGLADRMFAEIDADRERLGRFLPWVEHTCTVEDERRYIQMTLENWEGAHLFDYGIFLKGDTDYMGNLGVHTISWEHERCELGYWIVGRFEGKGYMSEAMRALEQVLFGLGFHRIEIHCSSANARSARVPELCGYQLDGRLREDRIEDGSRRDTLVFGKLAKAD